MGVTQTGVTQTAGVTQTGGTRVGTTPAPREIRVEIGELVLDGFRADPDRVSAAFEDELTRLVRERGVPADGPWTADVLSGLPPLPAGLSARRLGQELARAVHDGLCGRGEVTS
ncbi:hypothetical protein GCM10010313_21550 [Streptomyces violarus]|uniref:Uncharacterized protein n=1 Tax=Streptomyces violarus TaxID=67380 RepID=A0A7W4ZTM7_9ACTN|nr:MULTISPECIES: hypothetical protein [Streptomyces]MBB3078416.1 hypothetical protein [Streptomyces violarus]WRU02964.1 hypothetical protein VJ737_37095 [Streptomyces sp. CGMCC 4.1772]GHD05158.1 hypothetical protein GCM10010313_21550 [Streptomyces violarus]